MRLSHSLLEALYRALFLAAVAGGVWLLLQYYTEDEIVDAANRFWAWWSTLFTGQLATYWNPIGAAAVLGIAVLFVLTPITRLFRSRRGYNSYDSGGWDDGGDGSD